MNYIFFIFTLTYVTCGVFQDQDAFPRVDAEDLKYPVKTRIQRRNNKNHILRKLVCHQTSTKFSDTELDLNDFCSNDAQLTNMITTTNTHESETIVFGGWTPEFQQTFDTVDGLSVRKVYLEKFPDYRQATAMVSRFPNVWALIIQTSDFDRRAWQVLTQWGSLSHLELQNIQFNYMDSLWMSQNLILIRQLNALIIKNTSLTKVDLKIIMSSIKPDNLIRLEIPGIELDDDSANFVSSQISRSKIIEHVDLSGCDIPAESLPQIISKFVGTSTLKHLNLKGNKINLLAAEKFAEKFPFGRNLEFLDISDSEMTADSFKIMVKSMKSLTKLQTLILSNASSGDGIWTLKKAVKYFAQLETLDMTGWNFNAAKPKVPKHPLQPHGNLFETTVHPSKKFKNLMLRNCKLNEFGATQLAHIFNELPSLENVDMKRASFATPASKMEFLLTIQNVQLKKNILALIG